MNNKKIIVGYTGFVGSNLVKQTHFDEFYNSSNITDSFGSNPDILVYTGVPAEKFLANKEPEKDFYIINNAIENIKKINPKQVILISTVDVYPNPISVNEETIIDENQKNQAYGKNRLYLEKWVESNYENHLIIRLPALFGENLKKNFIFDIINIIPIMLNKKKFQEISSTHDWIKNYYSPLENSFYKLNDISENERDSLKKLFLSINFSALNFTDSNSIFQFYNLANLWKDINICLKNGINKINLATEPISAKEIYYNIYKKNFENSIVENPPHYDFHTLHSKKFSENDSYIQDRKNVLNDIEIFIRKNL